MIQSIPLKRLAGGASVMPKGIRSADALALWGDKNIIVHRGAPASGQFPA
jgi:hypothetical protein